MTEKITRKEQARNTKKKLIDTAIVLFKKYGYEKVTIEQICKTADVTTGAFYHHLKNKAGVIIEGYSEFDAHLLQYAKINSTADGQYIDKIMQCIDVQSEYVESFGYEAITEVYKTQLSEESEFFLNKDRAIIKIVNDLVIKAQNNEEIIKTIKSDKLTADIIIIARGVIYNWCQNKGQTNLADMTKRILRNYFSVFEEK